MIIVRSPLRISLGGGGTDLPSYYEKFGGFALAAAIDKYVYVTVHQSWTEDYFLKYSQLERVTQIEQIKHPIFRTALAQMNIRPNVEIVSIADIPAGTGLGSSGSFTVALLKALHAHKKDLIVSPNKIAEQACQIEIDQLREPVGKQDQYIAAYGGITCFDIARSGVVTASPAKISPHTIHTLEDNLVMFFTGYARSASELLKEQDDKTKAADPEMLENLHVVKDLGLRITQALEEGRPYEFGELTRKHWELKKKRSGQMSNPRMNDLYELALANGAIGGKLVGAGGGGFLLFYSENRTKLRKTMIEAGLTELRFHFDFEGAKVLF